MQTCNCKTFKSWKTFQKFLIKSLCIQSMVVRHMGEEHTLETGNNDFRGDA